MKQETWITGHVNAYRYFGGVTRILTPDNLKTGVVKNSRTETVLNKSYQEMAEHYSIPALVQYQDIASRIDIPAITEALKFQNEFQAITGGHLGELQHTATLSAETSSIFAGIEEPAIPQHPGSLEKKEPLLKGD